jgi:hypothetical protein
MIKACWVLVAAFVVSMGGAAAQPACSAKTCSQAYHACTTIRCASTRGKNCEAYCQPEYQRCLRTGEFRGHVCWDKGLKRQ